MHQDWINALVGGGLIGLSATLFLLLSGRIAGISGIFYGAIKPKSDDFSWRILFVLGLLLGGFIGSLFLVQPFENTTGRPVWALVLAGLFVGYGTRLGSGCTSGHGVCGISRLSPRSIVATCVFILSGILTVAALNYIFAGVGV